MLLSKELIWEYWKATGKLDDKMVQRGNEVLRGTLRKILFVCFCPVALSLAAVMQNGTLYGIHGSYSVRKANVERLRSKNLEVTMDHARAYRKVSREIVSEPQKHRIQVPLKENADHPPKAVGNSSTQQRSGIGMLSKGNLEGPVLKIPPSAKKKSIAKPFSVSIDKQRFYGGLIKYSHDRHPSQICRVMNGCIRSDDTLVLPEWMQRYDNVLKFQCGHGRVEFSLPDTERPPELEKLDLIGVSCPRPSMPDFVEDFMPNAVIFDLIYGDYKISKSCHSRKGNDCDGFPDLEEGLKPAVILHPRIRSLRLKKSWVREFVNLMKPPHSGRQPKILFDDTFRNESSDMTCFRSAMFTRGPYSKNIIGIDHLRHIHFLERHGAEKGAREVSVVKQSKDGERRFCSLNVTITNRRLVDGAHNRLIGRYVMEVARVREAILRQAKKIDGLKIKVSILRLEGKTLRWHMNAMQKTDIWVAGHGTLLTNMLFLRENSSVIELQPFAYYPVMYERMAMRLAHVKYERYIADPDRKAFKACMYQLFPEGHAVHADAMVLLDRFNQAATKYFRSDNTHSMVLHSLKDTELSKVKTCAHMQRLKVNARHLAVAVVRHGRIRCGFEKPKLRQQRV